MPKPSRVVFQDRTAVNPGDPINNQAMQDIEQYADDYVEQHTHRGTAADGTDVTLSANTNLSGIKQYRNLTINSGVTVTIDEGYPLILLATGTVTVNGTIEGGGQGAPGGLGGGTVTSNGEAGSAAFLGGAGAGGGDSATHSGAYGGSTQNLRFQSVSGAGGAPGGNGGAAPLARVLFGPFDHSGYQGGAGGGGGAEDSGTGVDGGVGGSGGGYLYIEAQSVVVGGSGTVRCNGAAGLTAVRS